jgi:hypothetical protein
MPRCTEFKGNDEDFACLDAQKSTEVPPGLVHLRNGCKSELERVRREALCLGGIGRVLQTVRLRG